MDGCSTLFRREIPVESMRRSLRNMFVVMSMAVNAHCVVGKDATQLLSMRLLPVLLFSLEKVNHRETGHGELRHTEAVLFSVAVF